MNLLDKQTEKYTQKFFKMKKNPFWTPSSNAYTEENLSEKGQSLLEHNMQVHFKATFKKPSFFKYQVLEIVLLYPFLPGISQ